MTSNLLDISTRKLLQKFGAGDHKPGSGSAAAFQGMLSAYLTSTVISLTTAEDRKHIYGHLAGEFIAKDKELLEKLIPSLEDLFKKDSFHFDRVIKLRNKRNEFKQEPKEYNRLEAEHLEELKVATEIPIKIGFICATIAETASFVFINGFQSARGDTSVALNGAISAIAGCISIIELNLLSFPNSEWKTNIKSQTEKLKTELKSLRQLGEDCSKTLNEELTRKDLLHEELSLLIDRTKKAKKTNENIEKAARNLQNLVWKHRKALWKKNTPNNHLDILNSGIIFKKGLNYLFFKDNNLVVKDEDGKDHLIAGAIDQKNKSVYLSKDFPGNVQNFTLAHELGHALLHTQNVLHRDNPLDGSTTDKKDPIEYQANKFASYFLMPEKQVLEEFKNRFSTSRFIVNEDTAFHLIRENPSKLKSLFKNRLGLARRIASTDRYQNIPFTSLAEHFKVSVEAMAIRLEELDLIESW